MGEETKIGSLTDMAANAGVSMKLATLQRPSSREDINTQVRLGKMNGICLAAESVVMEARGHQFSYSHPKGEVIADEKTRIRRLMEAYQRAAELLQVALNE